MGASQSFEVSLAAGASSGNILAGSMFEFVSGRPRAIQIWAVQDITANVAIQVRVTYGTVVAIEDGYLLPRVTAGTPPLKSDHEMVQFMAAPGDRIVINARNVGSATGAARFLVKHQDF